MITFNGKIRDEYKYFITGSTSVFISKFITYPLDRIKLINQTNKQNYNFIDIFKREKIRGYFKNFYKVGLINFPKAGLTFTILNYSNNNLGLNPFLSGIISGTITGSLFFPFEINNIKKTFNLNFDVPIKKIQNIKNILKLYSIHICGIQIYYGLNFGFFNLAKKFFKKYGLLGTFMSGVFAEYSTILITFPIDTIRKRLIVNYKESLYKNLYKGFKYSLIKSPISCGIFYVLTEFILVKIK
jgi:hypothetical protein